eukprot:12615578-Alexandrium_andersonii.AAC.1
MGPCRWTQEGGLKRQRLPRPRRPQRARPQGLGPWPRPRRPGLGRRAGGATGPAWHGSGAAPRGP